MNILAISNEMEAIELPHEKSRFAEIQPFLNELLFYHQGVLFVMNDEGQNVRALFPNTNY